MLNTDSKTLKNDEPGHKNQSKMKSWSKRLVIELSEFVQASSKLSWWVAGSGLERYNVTQLTVNNLLEHTVDMTEPCSKWTHLLQVLQPLQLQLGLQENKKAQECNMLLGFFFVFCCEQENSWKKKRKGWSDRTAVLFWRFQRCKLRLQKGCCERKRFPFGFVPFDKKNTHHFIRECTHGIPFW